MRSTGIVRKVDGLGRVVLPIEQRKDLSIDYRDTLEISVDRDAIVLKKYIPKCIFCKSKNNVIEKIGRYLCIECKSNLQEF